MPDAYHNYNQDLVASAVGDLLTADSLLESEQRVLRRLMTNPQDYIWQPTYGAGLPAKIGDPFDVATIESIVQSQMYLEDSVVRIRRLMSKSPRSRMGCMSMSLIPRLIAIKTRL